MRSPSRARIDTHTYKRACPRTRAFIRACICRTLEDESELESSVERESEAADVHVYVRSRVRACVRACFVCLCMCFRACVRTCYDKPGARAHVSHESVCVNRSVWCESQDRFIPFTKSASPLSRKTKKGDNLLGITPITKKFWE